MCTCTAMILLIVRETITTPTMVRLGSRKIIVVFMLTFCKQCSKCKSFCHAPIYTFSWVDHLSAAFVDSRNVLVSIEVFWKLCNCISDLSGQITLEVCRCMLGLWQQAWKCLEVIGNTRLKATLEADSFVWSKVWCVGLVKLYCWSLSKPAWILHNLKSQIIFSAGWNVDYVIWILAHKPLGSKFLLGKTRCQMSSLNSPVPSRKSLHVKRKKCWSIFCYSLRVLRRRLRFFRLAKAMPKVYNIIP